MRFQSHPGAVSAQYPGDRQADARLAVVSQAYVRMDERTGTFARETGIACPDGCGRCCHSPHVEATVIDLLPLAQELVDRGEAAAVLERLDRHSDDPRCVLFAADLHDENRGRCTMYAWRPSICRLFGFAGRRDADGRPQFTACRVHSQTMPDIVAAAQQAVMSGSISLPILSDLANMVASAVPSANAMPKPINAALREAIQTVALRERFAAMVESSDDDDNSTTPTPRMPPRRAA